VAQFETQPAHRLAVAIRLRFDRSEPGHILNEHIIANALTERLEALKSFSGDVVVDAPCKMHGWLE